MTIHTLPLTRENLHGHFSCDLPPVLTIDSGDSVHYQTLDAGWSASKMTSADDWPRFEPRDPTLDNGHAMIGPVAIRGAQPGMTLAIHVDALRPADWGWNGAGSRDSEVNRRMGVLDQPVLHIWTLDLETMTGRNQHGHTVALSPFMGVMGLAMAEPGVHSTTPPRRVGGNIDCKELVVGSTLYLPIEVEGALFSVGDGHALQADGESSGTAIECGMDHVALTFELLPDLQLTTPRAHTPAGWLTLGFDKNLNEATYIALGAMLDLMHELHGIARSDALALASLVIDLRVTQIANQVFGIHTLLAHDALK